MEALISFFKRQRLPLLSGLLLTLSFPNPFHPGFFAPGACVAWIALVPLLVSLEGADAKAAFGKGYACGFLFFSLSTAWINGIRPMGPGALPAWLSLSAYLALYPAAFGALRALGRGRGWKLECLWVPALWTLLEALRERLLTGFPWLSLGSSQAYRSPWLPLAAFCGVYGLHFLLLALNGLAALLCRGRFKQALPWALVVCAFLILRLSLPKAAPSSSRGLNVAVLQGNIDQDQEWTEDYQKQVMSAYGGQMRDAVQAGAQLILWPESSFPGLFRPDDAYARELGKFAKEKKVNILIGASSKPGEGHYNNGAVLISQDGTYSAFQKEHLVPFGEYLPLRKSIPLLDQVLAQMRLVQFEAGPPGQAPFMVQGLGVAPAICYESIYSGLMRQRCEGCGLISVLTLDSWFGDSAAPRVHFLQAALRSVENGVWSARSAATGISGFISPEGSIASSIELGTAGWSMQFVPQGGRETFYHRHGPWFLLLCLAFLLLPLLRLSASLN